MIIPTWYKGKTDLDMRSTSNSPQNIIYSVHKADPSIDLIVSRKEKVRSLVTSPLRNLHWFWVSNTGIKGCTRFQIFLSDSLEFWHPCLAKVPRYIYSFRTKTLIGWEIHIFFIRGLRVSSRLCLELEFEIRDLDFKFSINVSDRTHEQTIFLIIFKITSLLQISI